MLTTRIGVERVWDCVVSHFLGQSLSCSASCRPRRKRFDAVRGASASTLKVTIDSDVEPVQQCTKKDEIIIPLGALLSSSGITWRSEWMIKMVTDLESFIFWLDSGFGL